ncbi:MAG: glycosyltransferase [Lactobacillaceae bacterium]|jgi:poly(glycerol-phosphate) alpha-glucosyltransferase|nr:glycosyltransferase [Lactobacillaceae bacterium]
MIYSINEDIYSRNSGTEHAAAKRTQLFEGSKFVTKKYDRFLNRNLQSIGLQPEQVINMYDYFQGTTDVTRKEINVRDFSEIPNQDYYIDTITPNYSMIRSQGNDVARINILPATIGLVSDVEWFDRYNNLTVRENYDWRGFKSSVDHFDLDGQLSFTQYLNLEQVPVLEVAYMKVGDELRPTLFKLLRYEGERDFRFNSEEEMFAAFLNVLVEEDDNVVLISDRRGLDSLIAEVPAAKKRYAMYHGLHTPDVDLLVAGKTDYRIFDIYRPSLSTLAGRLDGILVQTPEQKNDLEMMIHDYLSDFNQNVLVAPDTFVQNTTNNTQRIRNRIIYAGLIADGKNLDQSISIIAEIKKKVPDVTFEIHGYFARPELRTQLQNQIEELDLKNNVLLLDYVTGAELDRVFENSELYLSTSSSESFNMSLVQALSFGVPVATIETTYGTNEIVEDNYNGLVFSKSESFHSIANKIVGYLNDQNKKIEMQENANKSATKFSKENMLNQFKELV